MLLLYYSFFNQHCWMWFIHIGKWSLVHCFLSCSKYSIVWLNHDLFIHFLVDGHFSGFQFFAINTIYYGPSFILTLICNATFVKYQVSMWAWRACFQAFSTDLLLPVPTLYQTVLQYLVGWFFSYHLTLENCLGCSWTLTCSYNF